MTTYPIGEAMTTTTVAGSGHLGVVGTVTPDGRGFPPDIARRKLAKLCRAAGHEPDLRYYAGFSFGPAPRGQS